MRMAKKFIADPKNSHALGPVNLVVNETGIQLNIKGSESFTNWENVIEMEETNKYIFIYFTTNSAVIIAKTGLDEKLETLRNTLKLYIKAGVSHA